MINRKQSRNLTILKEKTPGRVGEHDFFNTALLRRSYE